MLSVLASQEQSLVGTYPKTTGKVGSVLPTNREVVAPFCAVSLSHARQVTAKSESLVKGDNP